MNEASISYMYMWFEIQICRSFLVTQCYGTDKYQSSQSPALSNFNVMPFGICVIQKVVILQDASRCCLAVYSNLRGDPNYPCVGFSM